MDVMDVVDLRSFMESWAYDPGQNVRMGHGADGRKIILVRQPMGVEQYEADGCPDGRRGNVLEAVGNIPPVRIKLGLLSQPTTQDCARLFQDAGVYLHRLNLLFRLQDWTRAERDAAQILHLLDFIGQYARHAEDSAQVDLWRSHTARIHAVARIMILLDRGQFRAAFQTARDTVGLPAGVEETAAGRDRLAEALIDSVQGLLPQRPERCPPEASTFIRQEDYWTVRYHGHTAVLKSTRGLQCLALLLRFPEREFHVCELLASLLAPPDTASAQTVSGHLHAEGQLCVTTGLNGGSPVLDTRAKAECRRRLIELREELAEAEHFNDPDRAVKTQNELNAITQHLAAAVGLGGRDRKTSSEAERARCAVTKRIKQAIQKIATPIPSLGQHLSTRIKTGYFCSYHADPDHPVHWKF